MGPSHPNAIRGRRAALCAMGTLLLGCRPLEHGLQRLVDVPEGPVTEEPGPIVVPTTVTVTSTAPPPTVATTVPPPTSGAPPTTTPSTVPPATSAAPTSPAGETSPRSTAPTASTNADGAAPDVEPHPVGDRLPSGRASLGLAAIGAAIELLGATLLAFGRRRRSAAPRTRSTPPTRTNST